MKRRSIAKFASTFGGNRAIGMGLLSFAFTVPAFIAALFVLGLFLSYAGVHIPFFGKLGAFLIGGGGIVAAASTFKGVWKVAALAGILGFAAMGNGGTQPNPTQANAMARAAVLSQAVEMEQQIFSQAINPTTQTVIPIVPRNVGLIKRFRVIVSGNIQNTSGTNVAVRSPFGCANVLQNINFVDLQNNVRINTTGWHIFSLSTARYRDPYANALINSDYNSAAAAPNTSSTIGNYGNNFAVSQDVNGLAITSNANFRVVYEVPLAYSDDDLRGGIYANVINASMQLTLTLATNAQAFVAATPVDDTMAILGNGTCTYNGNLTVTVYQVYLDQLPVGQNGVVLPVIDLSTVYELKNTTFQNLVANNEFPVPYANFRDFLSTFAVYNSNGQATGHGNGTEINYWSLQSANFTNIWKLDPFSLVERTRKVLGLDFPPGVYYVSYRRKPISTVQYGNMQLIVNPITAAAGNYLLIGYEAFALQNQITQAGSLAAA